MKRLTNIIILLLFTGILLCDLWVPVEYFWPETRDVKFDLFLSSTYKEKLSVLWYMHDITSIVDRVVLMFVICKLASIISVKLFKAALVFFFFRVSQIFLYTWNANTSFFANLFLYATMALVLYILTHPDKTFNYKSLN